jgi:hypothetical protein
MIRIAKIGKGRSYILGAKEIPDAVVTRKVISF